MRAAKRNILFSTKPKKIFSVALVSSAIAEIGANKNPTFTRATASSVYDFEGHGWQINSGEIPFYGARRVKNILSYSEDVSNAVWNTYQFSEKVQYIPNSGPNGEGSEEIKFNGGSFAQIFQPFSDALKGNLTCSYFVKSKNISSSIKLKLWVSASPYSIDISVIPSSWKRLEFINNLTSGGGNNTGISNNVSNNSDDVLVTCAQLEDQQGNLILRSSEYIPTNKLSAPYYGVNADGVKCFSYQNGNTVSSNVVTEAQGVAISDAVLKGFQCKPQHINICTYSQDLTNWTSIGAPTITAISQNNGYETLDKIDDTSVIELQGKRNTIAFTGDGTKVISFTIKKDTATASLVRLYDSTAATVRFGCDITWTGTVPNISVSTGAEEKPKIALVNSCYRIFISCPSVVAANTNYLEVYPSATNLLDITNTGALLFGAVQVQNSTYSGPYLKTTNSAVTSNASVLSYLTTGNIKSSSGSIVLKFENITDITYTGYLWSSYTDANNSTSIFFDGTNLTFRKRVAGTNYDSTVAFTYAVHTRYTIVCNWSSSGANVFAKGVKGTSNTNNSLFQISSSMHIGNDGNSGNHCSGYFRDIQIYNKKFKDSKALALTI